MGIRTHNAGGLAAILACLVLCGPGSGRGETRGWLEHASRVEGAGGQVALWSPYDSKRLAILELATGRLEQRAEEVAPLTWPLALAVSGDSLWVLDREGERVVALERKVGPGGKLKPVRRFAPLPDGGSSVGELLLARPGGAVWYVARRRGGWELRERGAADSRVAGPLEEEPKAVAELGGGRLVIVDQARVWTWPEGRTLFWSDAGAPERWETPPPLCPFDWPHSVAAMPDGTLLFAGLGTLYAWREGGFTLVNRAGRGMRWPAEGEALTAAMELPAELLPLPDGSVGLWEKGGQRVLRVLAPEEGSGWRLATVWTLPAAERVEVTGAALRRVLQPPPGQHWLAAFGGALERIPELARMQERGLRSELEAFLASGARFGSGYHHYGAEVVAWNVLDRSGGAPSLVEAEGSAPTFEGVLSSFAEGEWVDLQEPLARFGQEHARELAMLEARREEAIAELLALGTGKAAMALALLRAHEADGWFRELVRTPEAYDWESGSSFPKAEVGRRCLEHLHRKPLRELVRLTPAELKALRAVARRGGRWGAPAHARALLSALGYSVRAE